MTIKFEQRVPTSWDWYRWGLITTLSQSPHLIIPNWGICVDHYWHLPGLSYYWWLRFQYAKAKEDVGVDDVGGAMECRTI